MDSGAGVKPRTGSRPPAQVPDPTGGRSSFDAARVPDFAPVERAFRRDRRNG